MTTAAPSYRHLMAGPPARAVSRGVACVSRCRRGELEGGAGGSTFEWSNVAASAVTSGHPLPGQADRHDQVPEVALRALQQARAQRADQPQHDLVALDGLDALAKELRVEADLERLAL